MCRQLLRNCSVTSVLQRVVDNSSAAGRLSRSLQEVHMSPPVRTLWTVDLKSEHLGFSLRAACWWIFDSTEGILHVQEGACNGLLQVDTWISVLSGNQHPALPWATVIRACDVVFRDKKVLTLMRFKVCLNYNKHLPPATLHLTNLLWLVWGFFPANILNCRKMSYLMLCRSK